MSFAQPFAWYLLLLAIPIILFYILKVRLRQEPVSTTIFWQQVFEERRTRSFWRRLRHLVSLLLSLLFLTILVGAVLDPVPSWQAKPTRCVIVVDNSAGMNAESGGMSRLDLAKTELRRLLETTEIGRQTALLTAGGPPRIVVGFTDHLGTLRRGVDSIAKTDYPTSLREAVELARQLVASEENSTVLVYTDGCVPDLAELQTLPNVHFFPVGEPIDNLAITRFQPRRSLGDAVGYEILIEAVNFGEKPVQARLEVELGDRTIDVVPLALEPNQAQTKIVRDATSQGGLLRATLRATDDTPEDQFQTDNRALAFLPERPTQHVYLHGKPGGEDDFFLLKVLQSQPNVELHLLAEVPSRVPEDGVLVLHQHVPEMLPAGKVLVIDPRNGCDLFDIGEALEVPIVAKEDADSPLMKFVHLMNLTIRGARTMTLKNPVSDGDSWTVLAETPEASPIYAALADAESERIVLTADLKQGDLALRTAFPIMVSQALIRFRGSGGELDRAWSTAEPVRLALRTATTQVMLHSPSGQESVFPIKSGTVSLGTLPECGVWTLHEPGSETVLAQIACNLSNSVESNLRLAPEEFYRQTPDAAALRSGVRPIWFWLAVLALVFTSLEWFLYQRRWID